MKYNTKKEINNAMNKITSTRVFERLSLVCSMTIEILNGEISLQICRTVQTKGWTQGFLIPNSSFTERYDKCFHGNFRSCSNSQQQKVHKQWNVILMVIVWTCSKVCQRNMTDLKRKRIPRTIPMIHQLSQCKMRFPTSKFLLQSWFHRIDN